MSQKIQEGELSSMSLKEFILRIKAWFDYFKAKWKVFFLFAFLGAFIGFLYTSFKKPVYIASLSFVLEDDKSGQGGELSGLANQFGFDVGGGGGNGIFSRDNLSELMQSRSLVQKTLLRPVKKNGKEISLAEFFIEFNDMRKDGQLSQVQFLPNSNIDSFTIEQNSVLGSISETIISKMLTVGEKNKKSSILSVDVTTENELFSKIFAEFLVKEVSEFYIDTKSKKAKMNLQILEYQTDSVRRELNSAISGVAVANDNTYNLNPALNVNRTLSVKREVDVQANKAILTQLVQSLEAAKVNLRKETPLIQEIDKPVLPLKKGGTGRMKGMILGSLLSTMIAFFWVTFSKLLQNAFSATS